MKKIETTILVTVAILLLAALSGCARFVTTQTDERTNEKTGEKTKISTKAKATTFWDSKSALANFKAAQTEKSQSASVGSLVQESSGTNTVKALEHIDSILKSVK